MTHPKWTLLVVGLLILLIATGVRNFQLDASAESLVLENDQDMVNYRMVNERFGTSEFLLVAYTPKWPLFSQPSLTLLKSIRDDLAELDRVASINTILDVPLLENPPVPVTELIDNIKTLEDPDADPTMARQPVLCITTCCLTSVRTLPLFN